MILQKKNVSKNANIKKFSIGFTHSNAVNNTKNIKNEKNKNSSDDEFDKINNKKSLRHTSSFRKNEIGKKKAVNSPYSKFNNDNFEKVDSDMSEKSTKHNNNLYMNIMSNHRPGPGGMMGINDVYSSDSDHSNSNDSNYFIDEEIEEPYNYNKNNVFYGTNQRNKLSKVNQRSNRDNYYDYDYDLTREDDDIVDVNDIYNEKRVILPKVINNYNRPDTNHQQNFLSTFNSFFH
ncbi:hypothetical protein BCR36DRAFT_154630 [Piromyces finnis]|uniref:Uncharacterized protein n=1 Tax=Piromyces finnis TaxID=1754191 RepID=A0A1Y1VJS5_9FUNG|nr:hypothetical protein BCR36DRAFT_154630 [Piromyces finnis]|eukprot:ORX57312.1 hypothetical protein BCR36DRAFT_154630 [Piromyces finnis]